jgi:hypothetical protein
MAEQTGKVIALSDISMHGRGRNRKPSSYIFEVLDTAGYIIINISAERAPDAIVKAINEWDAPGCDYDNPPRWNLDEFFALL